MKVVVLGAGVIGVTSAYYLRKAGHEVIVIDKQPGPALETSFANAGEISPGYASPWAAPGIPRKALKWIFMRHAPLILHPVADLEMWRWMFSLLANCSAAKYAINKARMVRLAEFSRDELIRTRAALSIDYDQRSLGTLQLFRTQQQMDGIDKDIDVLRAGNVPYEVMTRKRCVEVEPGLGEVAGRIVGGLLLPNDETGDCFKFTSQLCDLIRQQGVDVRFGQSAERVILDHNRVSAVSVAGERIATDACVVALGSFSPQLVRGLGLRLPIYPVKGYSITVPIVDAACAPRSTLMDETYKIAITRLGSRIRVGGMAEIAGFDRSLPHKRRLTLEHSLHSLFPKAGDLNQATFWSGLRPMTPDGTPILGATPIAGLYLNCGHGTLGWTMACGSAQVLADLISSKTPAIDASDLSVHRYI